MKLAFDIVHWFLFVAALGFCLFCLVTGQLPGWNWAATRWAGWSAVWFLVVTSPLMIAVFTADIFVWQGWRE